MRTPRWIALLAFAVLLAGCGGSKDKSPGDQAKKPEPAEQAKKPEPTPANPANPEYAIQLSVPFKVGGKRALDIAGKQVLERTVEKDGKVDKQLKVTNRVELKATVETLAVDQQGRETKAELKIERFVLIPEGEKEQEALPPGSIVIAETKDGRTQYRAKDEGHKLSRLAEHILPRTFTSASSGSAAGDQAFQTNKPQQAGATWPADKKYLGEQFKGMAAASDQLSGSGKLVAVQTVNGKKCLQLELTATLEGTGSATEPDMVPQELSIKALRKLLVPGDYATGPVEETTEVAIKHVLKGKPDSAKKGLLMDGRSVDTWTTKTVYAPK
jgi:hypothetical protein